MLKKNLTYLVLAGAALFAILITIFQTFISTRYYYMGFVPQAGRNGYAVELLGFGYALQIVCFLGLLVLINQVQSLGLRLFLTLQLIVPVLSVYLLHANGIASTQTVLLCTAAVALVAIISNQIKFRYRLKFITAEDSLIWVAVAIIVLYLSVLIYERGISNIVLSFEDVYEYRATTESSYVMFILRSAAVTFATVLFAYALVTGQRLIELFCIAVFILFFIYSGHKLFLFLIPFIYLARAAVKANRPYYLLLLYFVVMGLGLVAYAGLESTAVLNFAARRSIMIPGLLTEYYIDYFSGAEPLWFSHSKLGIVLGTYDPSVPPPSQLVGANYFNDDASANANWIASSYMNMGNIGILIYAPLVALLFSLPGALEKKRNEQIFLISGVLVYSSFMQNNDLITSFLSNGVAFFVLIWIIWGNMELRGMDQQAIDVQGRQ